MFVKNNKIFIKTNQYYKGSPLDFIRQVLSWLTGSSFIYISFYNCKQGKQ